ncbi:MAG: hypothetical protein V3W20_00590 [Candidatus Neomarinimicrobiota bacterium]
MKILYIFDTKDHEVFKMSDLPKSFEILREGKEPIVFKPAATQMQDLQGRLDEAEALLKRIDGTYQHWQVNCDVEEYFSRHSQ